MSTTHRSLSTMTNWLLLVLLLLALTLPSHHGFIKSLSRWDHKTIFSTPRLSTADLEDPPNESRLSDNENGDKCTRMVVVKLSDGAKQLRVDTYLASTNKDISRSAFSALCESGRVLVNDVAGKTRTYCIL